MNPRETTVMPRRKVREGLAAWGAAGLAALAACGAPSELAPDNRPNPVSLSRPSNSTATPPAVPTQEPTSRLVKPKPTFVPTKEQQQLSDETIIKNEIQRLGIQPNLEEQILWRNAKPEFNLLLPNASQSKNEHIQKPAKTVITLKNQGRAYITVGNEGLMAILFDEKKGTVWKIIIPQGIFTQPPLSVTIQIINPLSAARESFLFEQRLAFKSPRERFLLNDQRLKDKATYSLLAAEHHGRTARAYITQWGLMGDNADLPSGHMPHAARFIEYGSNEQDPRWIKYVMSLTGGPTTPPFKPKGQLF